MDVAALNKFSYGLYIAGAKMGDKLVGSVVDAVMQASFMPATVILSSMKANRTGEVIYETGEFSLSVLPRDVNPFYIANFGFQSSRTVDKWANCPHELREGLPVLRGCVAYVRCRVKQTIDLSTHTLFIAEAEDAWNGDGEPLIYADYQARLKTATMDAFKAYKESGQVSDTPVPKGEKKAVWRCGVCGYEYDGDVPFERLPDDYVCPLCKQPKSVFSKQE